MEILFSNAIGSADFIYLLILCSVLAFSIKISYRKFINDTFAQFELSKAFVLISLSTFFVIFLVKNSIALSLGLVGALSIVRFRTPIKDPFELAMIFVCIAIGIACAVNIKPIAIIFTLFIHLIIISAHFFKNMDFINRNPKSFFYQVLNSKNNSYIIEIESDKKINTENILFRLKQNKTNYRILSQSIGQNNILIFEVYSIDELEKINLIESIEKSDSALNIILRENV